MPLPVENYLSDPHSDRAVIAAYLGGFVLFFMLVALVFGFVSDISTTAVLAGLICVVGMTPALVSWWRGRLDVMEIIHPALAFYVVAFGLRTFYLLQFGPDDPFRPDFSDTINLGLVYALLGICAFLFGYYSGFGDRPSVPISLRSGGMSKTTSNGVVALFVIGAACRAYVYSTGYYTRFLAGQRESPPGYLMVIDYIGFGSYYALMLGVALTFVPGTSKGFKLFVWTVLVPVTFIMAMLGGAKSEVIWLVLGILLAYHYLVKPITWKVLLLNVMWIILLMFPVVNTYREVSGMNLDLTPIQVLPLMGEALSSYFSYDYAENVFDAFMGRFPGIDAVSVVVKFTPEFWPFQYGKTIIIAPIIAFIPTILWPEKYAFINSIVDGVEFGRLYFGLDENASGVSITQLGELYLNFGWFGILVGMFLIGILFRFVYRTFIEYGRNPLGLLVYVFVYVHLIFVEGWFGSTYSNLFKHFVLTSLLVYVFKTNARRAPKAILV